LDEGGMYRLMKRFNRKIKGDRYGRCILLIIGANNPETATVMIYQPLRHSSVPRGIADCCEFAYISNTQSEFLPERTVENSNALCLSFHIHRVSPRERVERVYLTDGKRNVRVFKSTLYDTLAHFGVCNDIESITWTNNREFNDHQFELFTDSLFPEIRSSSDSPALRLSETQELLLEDIKCIV